MADKLDWQGMALQGDQSRKTVERLQTLIKTNNLKIIHIKRDDMKTKPVVAPVILQQYIFNN